LALADTKLARGARWIRRGSGARRGGADRRKCAHVRALARHSRCVDRARGTSVAIRPAATRRGAAQFKQHQAATPHIAPQGAVQRPEEDVMQLVNFVKSFVRNDEGQDLLEYALLVALIALVAIAAVTAAGTSVSTIFQSIADKLKAAAGA
jgi:pilus assembly protein Flp/PilA